MAVAVFAATSGRAGRLIAQVRRRPSSNDGRYRRQGQGDANLIQKIRNSRQSAEITQLLERIKPETVKEYSMGISAYGRARDWKRALSLLKEMRERGVTPNVYSFNAALLASRDGRVEAVHIRRDAALAHLLDERQRLLPLPALLASGDGRVEAVHIRRDAALAHLLEERQLSLIHI